MPRSRKILYLQYSNPAAYPPLEHSSRILAERGWEVLFAGVRRDENFEFQAYPNIRVKMLPKCPPRQGLIHYLRFFFFSLSEALRFRPDWIYVSEAAGCPAGGVAALFSGARVLYHEHDAPADERELHPLFRWARRRLAHQALLCVVPNVARGELLQGSIGTLRSVVPVWNCPSAAEAQKPKAHPGGAGIKLLYHGSLVPSRLPVTVLEAMKQLPPQVTLTLAGYETPGQRGYVQWFLEEAEKLGVGGRVSARGSLPFRQELIEQSRDFDAGLSLMPAHSPDPNLSRMAGASNKTFDYLACGLPVLVSDEPSWRGMFVETGYGFACDPDDPASIAQALRRWLEDPEGMRRMGELGRRRIEVDWNYERQFAPVLKVLES